MKRLAPSDYKIKVSKLKGFTFIEILVVITIIGVLVVIGVVSYSSVNKRSRDARRKSDIEQIRSALEMYRADKGYYPDSGSTAQFDSISLVAADLSSYLPTIPSDPKDNSEYPYKIKMTDSRGSPLHAYGYCLAAFIESVGLESNTCAAADTLPNSSTTSEQYKYGVKNP